MALNILVLLLSLGIILLSCELFTNAIEWFGKRLRVGDGVIGSIFSAVGTCLPETSVPILALLSTKSRSSSVDISTGAIVGAPFMLGTLAFFITGFSVLIFRRQRRTGMKMNINTKILSRDIGYFIVVYSIGLCAAFIRVNYIRYSLALFLLAYYIYYIILTVKKDNVSHIQVDTLYMAKTFNVRPRFKLILVQLATALGGIVFGAELFVSNIEHVANNLGVSTLVLALIITPIATELPEKFNSIIWIGKTRDTLALGNITGAMVFQSCIPVAIGILATPWQLNIKVIVSAVLAISSSLIIYIWIKAKKSLNPFPLMIGGLFYLAFIWFLAVRGFK